MGNITNIQKALDKTLKKFGVDNGIEVALSNIDEKTDTSIPFLEGVQINTGNDTADLGVTDIRGGFYQVNIRYSSHTGSSSFNKMADLLEETFAKGKSFYHGGLCVNITSFVPGDLLTNNGWGVFPVTINWDCYTAQL